MELSASRCSTDEAPVSEPYLFVIRAGPVWKIDQLRCVVRALGQQFEGEIVTWSDVEQRIAQGRFKARTFAWRMNRPRLSRVGYMARVLLRAISLRWRHGRRLVVISYDPLQSGVLGLLVKAATGALFVCEVNGVYWHPDTFIDIANAEAAETKRKRMVALGSAVLSRADAIKLLYPGQLEGFRLRKQPLTVSFPDVVDSVLFEPTGTAPENRVILIGFPYLLKGVDLLLDAFNAVADDFPDWRLMLVGWELEQPAREHGFIPERVEILGPQPPEGVRTLIEGSSLLVLPSRSEGMGRVLLEAALLGRARIGSRAGGIPTVIEDGIDGLLFETGDTDALEQALRAALSSPELRKTLGNNARERALREFTEKEFSQRYRDLVNGLLARRAH